MQTVECVWHGGALLGEGPVWDAARRRLWFVDIKRHLVYLYDPAERSMSNWKAPGQIGWVLPSADGTMLAGLQDGLACFDPTSGRFTPISKLAEHPAGNRLNDAAIGPDGTVWFGSMDDSEQDASGRVYRFDGQAAFLTDITPVAITNGPALSPDGATLYHVDTAGGVIHAVPVGPDNAVGDVVEFFRIDPADGHPDGVTVDVAGNIWVGLWAAGARASMRPMRRCCARCGFPSPM